MYKMENSQSKTLTKIYHNFDDEDYTIITSNPKKFKIKKNKINYLAKNKKTIFEYFDEPCEMKVTNETRDYPYKRINHLNEKLNQFQQKESIDIPNEIYEIIEKNLNNKGIEKEKATHQNIRLILKKHRLAQYYEHLIQIHNKITGTQFPTISQETENKIIEMFQKVNKSWYKCKPENRNSFLNYNYILNKLFKIIDLKIHSDLFPLLKSKEKLKDQDVIWKKICDDQEWNFHSSL
jgi:Poxvirus Late Transcription Factor VLTF3 like